MKIFYLVEILAVENTAKKRVVKAVFLQLDRNAELARAVVIIINDGVSKENLYFSDQSKYVFSFFFASPLKEKEGMFFVFLSS